MLKAGTVEEYLPQGTKLSRQQLAEINFADVDLKTLRVTNKPVNERIRAVLDAAAAERAKMEEKSEDQIDKILQPDELPPGVIQLVKVYVARSGRSRWATRWPAVTGTRASSRASCRRRTCRSCRTARRWTSSSTRWACRRV